MKTKYTKDVLGPIVRQAKNWSDIMRALDLSVAGGNYRNLQRVIKALEIDISHFTGNAWNKGETKETHDSVRSRSEIVKIPDSEVFKENSTYLGGAKLRRRLLELGWDYLCNQCGISEWQNKPLTLHLDHINGNHTDNRFENLRFLCPNCHQQTPTWGNITRKP